MRRLFAALGAAAVSAPAVALACPSCARESHPGVYVLIGAMISVPYAVTVLVLRAIRRADAESLESDILWTESQRNGEQAQ